jgi:hypothetical protein
MIKLNIMSISAVIYDLPASAFDLECRLLLSWLVNN